jgi:hypothetical protein
MRFSDRLESHIAYRIMEGFIETLPSGSAKNCLADAIQGKGAFRRFKDRFFDYPDLRQAWFRFEEEANRKLVLEWLEDSGIEANVTFGPLPPA